MDDIFVDKHSNEEFIVKNIFLYFFELMGVAEKDALEYLCSYIAKNHDENKLLSIFNDDIKISFEKTVFFNSDKKSLAQKKLLKKFCKILIINIVDGLP